MGWTALSSAVWADLEEVFIPVCTAWPSDSGFACTTKDLPGKPDLVFPKHRAVIFVHGCFWHGHACHLFKMAEDPE